jgi:Zn-dependent metalloprotease
MDNAYWDGQAIYYGNGDVAFDPLAGSLDVAGHEMSHGVVQATANLEYQGQSGALNESFADVFGVMIDRNDWTLGEEVVNTQYFPSGALRSMSDPNQGGSSLNDPGYQPAHMNDLYTGSQDNGGVHINSGIPNHAFYLLAQATTKAKAENIPQPSA